MCGIIAAFNKTKTPVNDWVINQFEDQQSRGTEGFGTVKFSANKPAKVDRATETTKALLDLYKSESNMIMMHHRTPTSTPNKLDQTHPMQISHASFKYNYLVIHNGVITNDDDLKEEHEKLGFKYTTKTTRGAYDCFNDSEAIAIEACRFIEGLTDKIGSRGGAAFMALALVKDGKKKNQVKTVYFGRNEGSPLNLAASHGKIRLSSEGPGSEVKPFILYSFAPTNLNKISKRKMPFTPKPIEITLDTSSGNAYNNWGRYNGYSGYNGYSEPKEIGFKEEPTLVKEEEEKQNELDDTVDIVASYAEAFLDNLNHGASYYDLDTAIADIRNELKAAQDKIQAEQINTKVDDIESKFD